MSAPDEQAYYNARAASARELAQRAASPKVAAIHTEFADPYEQLAVQPEPQDATLTDA